MRSMVLITPALLLLAAARTASASQMIVERTAIQQIEDGPLVTLDYEFRPGETVYYSFRLAKFETIEDDDKQKLQLTYRIEVKDPRGTPVVEPYAGKITTEMLPEDRNWTPKGRWSFNLPDYAEGGKYTITLIAQDLIGKTEARATSVFVVNNRNLEPADALVVRSFGFYPSEESVRILDPAVYKAGELVWVKFDLTGYKLGPANEMDVQYGLTVLDPSGKVSLAQPEAAREKFQGYYPKRWVPAIFNLTLPPNVTLGVYTLVLTIRDHIGNQDLELRRDFTIQ